MKRIIKSFVRPFAPKIRFDIAPGVYCYVTGYAEIQEICEIIKAERAGK